MFALNLLLRPKNRASRPVRIKLGGREAYCLPTRGETLRVIFGCAWVTLDSKDLILRAGESIALTQHGQLAVTSALGGRLMVCELM